MCSCRDMRFQPYSDRRDRLFGSRRSWLFAKIGLGKLESSSFWAWYEWYHAAAPSFDVTPTDKDFMLNTFQKLALHNTADLHYFAPGADLSKQIFVWQVNFMESFRTDEERHATDGWQAACVSAKARCLALAQGGQRSRLLAMSHGKPWRECLGRPRLISK